MRNRMKTHNLSEEQIGNIASIDSTLARDEMGHLRESVDNDKDGINMASHTGQTKNEVYQNVFPNIFGDG